MTGVYEARKKNGEIYYRASFTYKNKHISLGSSSDEASCHAMYNEACEITGNSSEHWIDTESRTTSYNDSITLPLSKYISLINFRDMSRVGYYFVNDYGMQTSILSRFGVRSHSVKGRDYVFKNGDTHNYRYENIQVINRYNGVTQFSKNGRIMYRTKIHINGDYILGEFLSENEAAVAYNKAIDMLSGLINIAYTPNYIEGISSVEYASLYHNIILSKNFRNYVKSIIY